jgi:hypothetical protein
MRRVTGCLNVLVVLAFLGCSGCYESAFPIDSSPQADVEPALLGVWRCLPFDEAATEPAVTLTIARGAERRYAVTLQEDGDSAESYEAHASSIDGEVLFNVRKLEGGSKPWVFVRRTLVRPNLLHLQVLSSKALTPQDSPVALRKAVEQLRGTPGAYEDSCACVRTPAVPSASPAVGAEAPR